MSNYTSIMLIIPGIENENKRIEEVNTFELRNRKIKLNSLDYLDMLPKFTFAGTFKDFDLHSFLVHLQSVKWEYPEYVQLIIQEEDTYSCKVYSHAGAKLEVDSIKWSTPPT